MKVLLTSGGTKVPIDAVRHIGNMSRGTFGREIALGGLHSGWELDYLYAEGSRAPHLLEVDLSDTWDNIVHEMEHGRNLLPQVNMYHSHTYKDFESYHKLLLERIDTFKPDVVVLAAAVSDYGTVPHAGKVRSKNSLTIELTPLPKIINSVKNRAPNTLLVGFKLLVDSTDEQLIEAAQGSIANNGCDLVVANDLRDIRNNEHRVILVTANDVKTYTQNCAAEVVRSINDLKR